MTTMTIDQINAEIAVQQCRLDHWLDWYEATNIEGMFVGATICKEKIDALRRKRGFVLTGKARGL